MSKTSIISHPPNIAMVIVRQDYIGICGNAPDKNCAAAILNQFEFWMNIKLNHRSQAQKQNESLKKGKKGDELPTQDTELWVWKTMADIQEELFSIWKEDKIRDCRKWLEDNNFLLKRRNPKHGWDRTLQYMINVGQVQMSINRWFRESIADNSGVDSGNIRTRLLELLDSNPDESASNTIDYLQRLLDIANIPDEFIPSEKTDGVSPPKKDEKDPKYDLINQFLGIYWDRFSLWYKKKHNTESAKSKETFRKTCYKDAESIAHHDLDFTIAEFVQTIEGLSASEWYITNGKFPSWSKIADQIPITVQSLRGMITHEQTPKENTPKNRFSD